MKKSLWKLVCAAGWLLTIQRGAAQFEVLHIPNVTGQSVVSHHTGDIDLTGFNWSLSNPFVSVGQNSNPTFSDVTVTKLVDSSSPILASACAIHTSYTSAAIYCTTTINSSSLDFYTVTLGNCTVTGVTVNSQSSSGPLTETITLHFTTIQWTYVPVSNGTAQTPITTHYP